MFSPMPSEVSDGRALMPLGDLGDVEMVVKDRGEPDALLCDA
jgi:hypothetical protein